MPANQATYIEKLFNTCGVAEKDDKIMDLQIRHEDNETKTVRSPKIETYHSIYAELI